MTHSPEPWKVDDHGHPYNDADVVDAEGESVIDWPDGIATRDDAERLVSCVNALQGIEDPQAFMAGVRRAISNLGRAESDLPGAVTSLLKHLRQAAPLGSFEEFT